MQSPTKQRVWIPQIIVSAMLLWALYPDNPYGYYTILRLVACGVFAYLVFRAIVGGKHVWAWAFGIVAILYNPFVPVHLDRDIWVVLNLLTAGIAIVSIYLPRIASEAKGSHDDTR